MQNKFEKKLFKKYYYLHEDFINKIYNIPCTEIYSYG